MRVVVRIEVRRPTSGEGVEARDLALELFDTDRGRHLILMLGHCGGKIGVQPYAEMWQLRADRCGLRAERSVYEQARARDDALAVGLRDTSIDPRAEPVVVGIDNQAAHRFSTPSSHCPIAASSRSAQVLPCSAAIRAGQMAMFASRAYSAVAKRRVRSEPAGSCMPCSAAARR